MVTHICNSSPQKAKTGGSPQIWGQLRLYLETVSRKSLKPKDPQIPPVTLHTHTSAGDLFEPRPPAEAEKRRQHHEDSLSPSTYHGLESPRRHTLDTSPRELSKMSKEGGPARMWAASLHWLASWTNEKEKALWASEFTSLRPDCGYNVTEASQDTM